VEDLTLDQIFLLSVSEKSLERLGDTYTTTPQELQREGLIPSTGGGSLVQRLKAARAAQAATQDLQGKRQRRRERRAQLIQYKLECGET
jgi:hypothetical protein